MNIHPHAAFQFYLIWSFGESRKKHILLVITLPYTEWSKNEDIACIADGNFVIIVERFSNIFTIRKLTKLTARYFV